MSPPSPPPSVILTPSQLSASPFPALRSAILSRCQFSFLQQITSRPVSEAGRAPFPPSRSTVDLHWQYTRFLFQVVMDMSQTYTNTQLQGMLDAGAGRVSDWPWNGYPTEKAAELIEKEYGAVEVDHDILTTAVRALGKEKGMTTRERVLEGGLDDMMLDNKPALGPALALLCAILWPSPEMSNAVPINMLIRHAGAVLDEYIDPLSSGYSACHGNVSEHIKFRTAVGAAVKDFSEKRGNNATTNHHDSDDTTIRTDISVSDIPIFQLGRSPSRVRGRERNGTEGELEHEHEHDHIRYQDKYVLGDIIMLLKVVFTTWRTELRLYQHDDAVAVTVAGWDYSHWMAEREEREEREGREGREETPSFGAEKEKDSSAGTTTPSSPFSFAFYTLPVGAGIMAYLNVLGRGKGKEKRKKEKTEVK